MRTARYIQLCRRAAALLLCGLTMLPLTACGKDGPKQIEYREGAQFTVAVTEEPATLNPLTATSKVAQEFFLLAYDPLWRLNAEGDPVECLAEDYSLSSDKLTWTIRLRHDAYFSDGIQLTSADVKYTYETMMVSSPVYDPCFDGIRDIRCPDEFTVVITTDYVKGDMRMNPVPILPQHIWSEHSSDLRGFDNARMIGSGPFVLQEGSDSPQDVSWTFQARSDHFIGEPAVGSVRFVYYGTENGAGRAVSVGEADAAINMTDVQLAMLQGVPGVRLVQAYLPGSEVWAIAFNTRKGVFADQSMRQMVEYCSDRAWMLSMSSGEAGMAGSVWASPGADYFYNIVNLRPFDVETGRNILYTLGYSDVDRDGYMEDLVTGDKLILQLWSSSQDSWSSTAGTVLGEALKQIGVQLDWHTTDGSVTDVCTPKGSWDMCMLSWRGSVNPVLTARKFRTAANSLTGWSSESYMNAFSQLQVSMDDISVQNTTIQLQQIFYDECPYVVLAYHSDIQAIREDRWTGYDQVLEQAGGLFGIESLETYMTVRPLDAEAEIETGEGEQAQ